MGWLQQVVVASEVIITDTDGNKVIVIDPELQAELFYSPAEGPGNLIMSLAAAAGTDQFGNSFPQGLRIDLPTQAMPAMENGWVIDGHARYTLDPLGNLVVSWKQLTPGPSPVDGTQIWAAGSLPDGYAPADDRRMACYCDSIRIPTGSSNPEGAALQIQADGSVLCFGVSAAATRVDLFAVVPLNF